MAKSNRRNGRNIPRSTKQVFLQFGKWVCIEKKIKRLGLHTNDKDFITVAEVQSKVASLTAEELKCKAQYQYDIGWYIEVPSKRRPATEAEIKVEFNKRAAEEKRKEKAIRADIASSARSIKDYERRIERIRKNITKLESKLPKKPDLTIVA